MMPLVDRDAKPGNFHMIIRSHDKRQQSVMTANELCTYVHLHVTRDVFALGQTAVLADKNKNSLIH